MRPFSVKTLGLALSALMGFSACSILPGFKDDDSSLVQVDELLDRIERVHVECEIARERVDSSLEVLQTIMTGEFGMDPIQVYEEYVESIERSEEQERKLREKVETMEEAAEEVFDPWASDLETIENENMRRRGRIRLNKARERYRAILLAADPATAAYSSFNRSLRDHAKFLGHDLNVRSVGAIRGETRHLRQEAAQLDQLLESCLEAAQVYVRAAALPGQSVEAPEEPETRERR